MAKKTHNNETAPIDPAIAEAGRIIEEQSAQNVNFVDDDAFHPQPYQKIPCKYWINEIGDVFIRRQREGTRGAIIDRAVYEDDTVMIYDFKEKYKMIVEFPKSSINPQTMFIKMSKAVKYFQEFLFIHRKKS